MKFRNLILAAVAVAGLAACSSPTPVMPPSAPPAVAASAFVAPSASPTPRAGWNEMPLQVLDRLRSYGAKPLNQLPTLDGQFRQLGDQTAVTHQGCLAFYNHSRVWVADLSTDWCLASLLSDSFGSQNGGVAVMRRPSGGAQHVDRPGVNIVSPSAVPTYYIALVGSGADSDVYVVYDPKTGGSYQFPRGRHPNVSDIATFVAPKPTEELATAFMNVHDEYKKVFGEGS